MDDFTLDGTNVREQLYPECRGWVTHKFDTVEQAQSFIDQKESR